MSGDGELNAIEAFSMAICVNADYVCVHAGARGMIGSLA